MCNLQEFLNFFTKLKINKFQVARTNLKLIQSRTSQKYYWSQLSQSKQFWEVRDPCDQFWIGARSLEKKIQKNVENAVGEYY